MATHVNHGYVNTPEIASSNSTSETDAKTRYMNVADADHSVEYDTIDYELMSREGSKKDSLENRSLQTVSSDKGHPRDNTRKQIGKQAGTDPEREHPLAFLSNRTRKCGGIIVIIVVILVALATTSAVLFVTLANEPDTSSSPSQGITTTTTTAPSNTTESLEEKCQKYGAVFPHPSVCQAYYNCSEAYGSDVQNITEYTMECPYPRLFSAETLTCEHFEKVTCGDRIEAKNICDYRNASCGTVHCIPCDRYHYHCEGKPDGLNPQESRLWSPYYVVCYKERFVRSNTCPPSDGVPQYFSPDFNACVSLYYIPREHGGWMPNCTGTEDGFYPNEYRRCNTYTQCSWGQYIDTHTCAGGTTFDEVLKICVAYTGNLCICAGRGCLGRG